MVLGIKETTEEELSPGKPAEHHENTEEVQLDDFMAGFEDVDLPEFGSLPNSVSGTIPDDHPDLPTNLSEAVNLAQPMNLAKDEVGLVFPEPTMADLRNALATAVKNGLDESVAQQITNFCLSGLEIKHAMLIASYAIDGLDAKQVSQLCLMSIAGRSADEIKHHIDVIGGEATQGQGSVLGSPVGTDERQSSRSKSDSSINPVSSALRSVKGGLSAALSKLMESKAALPSESLKVEEEAEDGLDQAIASVRSSIREFDKGETDPAKSERAFKVILNAGYAFEAHAKKALGSASSKEEAKTIMEKVRSAKSSLLDECKEYLGEDHQSNFKDFFKALDEKLRKIYHLVKSRFTAEEKLAQLSSDEAAPSIQ